MVDFGPSGFPRGHRRLIKYAGRVGAAGSIAAELHDNAAMHKKEATRPARAGSPAGAVQPSMNASAAEHQIRPKMWLYLWPSATVPASRRMCRERRWSAVDTAECNRVGQAGLSRKRRFRAALAASGPRSLCSSEAQPTSSVLASLAAADTYSPEFRK